MNNLECVGEWITQRIPENEITQSVSESEITQKVLGQWISQKKLESVVESA